MLIDFAMPGMNGAQLAQAMRERHPGPADRLRHRLAESEQLEGAGADVPMLRKPFGTRRFRRLVADARERRAKSAP